MVKKQTRRKARTPAPGVWVDIGESPPSAPVPVDTEYRAWLKREARRDVTDEISERLTAVFAHEEQYRLPGAWFLWRERIKDAAYRQRGRVRGATNDLTRVVESWLATASGATRSTLLDYLQALVEPGRDLHPVVQAVVTSQRDDTRDYRIDWLAHGTEPRQTWLSTLAERYHLPAKEKPLE